MNQTLCPAGPNSSQTLSGRKATNSEGKGHRWAGPWGCFLYVILISVINTYILHFNSGFDSAHPELKEVV